MIISELRLRPSRVPGGVAEPLQVTPITVFVGPNNSGKSLVLSEIEKHCSAGVRQASTLVLDDLTFAGLSDANEADVAIAQIELQPNLHETVAFGQLIVGSKKGRNQIDKDRLRNALQHPNQDPAVFGTCWLSHRTLMLDGKSRIGLVDDQPAGDLQASSQTSLQVLFKDDTKRLNVRRIVEEAFGLYFVVDPTHLGHFRVRLSRRPPYDHAEERGIDDAAVRFHAQAQLVREASDGVKAFTGIINELIAGDPQILLIDEPEAFLHPPLAFKLGYEVSRAAIASKKNVFASTHSPQFVMGCVQSGIPISIVRLTYRDGVATARSLPSADLLKLMRNPLLRSTSVISALFYEFVVVTESDADRAFYQEINERLLRFKPDWGIPNCLFINAQNKQTVRTILKPLRQLGIPTVGIVDIDILKDGGSDWANHLDSAYLPTLTHTHLGGMRNALKKAFDATGKNMKRDGGIDLLDPNDRGAAVLLFDQLCEYGLFVVRKGELESWLKQLGVTGHGPPWLIKAFEQMGEDQEASGYVKPSNNDVWEFMSGIRAWLTNPVRKGLPS